MNEYIYAEYVSGSINNRGIFIPESSYKSFVSKAENFEYFVSVFRFPKEVLNEGVNFLNLRAAVNNIWIDLDRKKDESDKELMIRIKDFIDLLVKKYNLEENYQVYLSGDGFHVKIPDIFGFEPSIDLHLIVKETIYNHFDQYSPDYKIYHKRGLIRGEYSYNPNYQVYKNLLNDDIIWNMSFEEIKEYCRIRRYDDIRDLEYDGDKYLIFKPFEKTDFRLVNQPSNIVTCMQKMYEVGEVVGTRHERCLRLASWLMRNGVPYKAALVMLQSYTPTLEYTELEKLTASVYEKKYMYSCNDRVMREFCDSRCIFYKKKNYLPEVYGATNLENHYRFMIQGDWKNRSINLKQLLNLDEDYWLLPGNVVGIIGDTGVNKSALLQNFAVKLKEFEPILYVNTEMSELEFYERFLMIAYDKSKDEIREHYKYNENTLGKIINHVIFTSSTPSWEGLVDIVTKIKPKVLIIDVIDDIFTSKLTLKDEEKQYMEIKNLSKQLDLITFLVHHISKSSSGMELTKHSAKGSSAFEQKADVVIGIETIEDNLRVIRTLKSRSNKPFRKQLKVSDRFIFYEG